MGMFAYIVTITVVLDLHTGRDLCEEDALT
jgi:hypothetical protein